LLALLVLTASTSVVLIGNDAGFFSALELSGQCALQIYLLTYLLKGWFSQVSRLSQRDRAAGWISYGQKCMDDWNCETIFYGRYRSVFNHCDVIGQQSNQIR